jgi:hypothetical protein
VHTDMELWSEIRRRVLVEGVSKRAVVRDYGIGWRTLAKILAHPEPPGFRLAVARPKPKLGAFMGVIDEILASDRDAPVKQRHTVVAESRCGRRSPVASACRERYAPCPYVYPTSTLDRSVRAVSHDEGEFRPTGLGASADGAEEGADPSSDRRIHLSVVEAGVEDPNLG